MIVEELIKNLSLFDKDLLVYIANTNNPGKFSIGRIEERTHSQNGYDHRYVIIS